MKKLEFHKVVWYFFVYSILGMIMENIVCLATSFHIESRKGFVIGPFCPIYGVGAIILTLLLTQHKGKWFKLFLWGMFWGCGFEYFSSYVLQALYGVKFWNYKDQIFQINGRTSLMYTVCWGVLSIALIYWMNPHVDRFIEKFKYKSLDVIIIAFMTANCALTYFSIERYVARIEGPR